MATTVLISPKTLRTIKNGRWSGTGIKGFLVGALNSKDATPISVSAVWQSQIVDTNEPKEDIDKCLSHFPAGTNVVGVVFLPSEHSVKGLVENDQGDIDREFEEVFGNYSFWLEQMGMSQIIVLGLWRKSSKETEWHSLCFTLNEDSVLKTEINCDHMTKPLLKMRLKAEIPLHISIESQSEDQMKSILDHELMKLQNHSLTGGFVFGFDENKIILQKLGRFVGSTSVGWSTCGDIIKFFIEQDGSLSTGGRKKSGASQQIIVPVSLLQLITVEPQTPLQYAPIIRHHTGTFKTTHLSLPIDILVEVEETLPVAKLSNVLSRAVSRQIAALFECLSVYTQDNRMHTPEVFHFKPSCLETPVTVIYPKGATENELEKERQILHEHLCLPLNQPLLRKGAAGFFLRQTAPGGYLLNPHLGLNDPPVKSATVSVVDGYYSYHHYMQDHFDDDKWGCAYRSLQTICSWFKYQGYTEKNIPTHKEIQQALFEVGDKEQKFVGSRQWIGSFEVSYVLDHLLGVTSKFINVNAGSELSSTGQQLANHFKTQGTPVMIGGGVLAHTILGVAYDEMTGDISFLILDPHYTGGEDIKIIQDKGWCGWKDMNFWNQTAHYNLCLPQLPVLI
ncbi:ufm1-specific protease 2-like [Physella acuta]|uniref:ufm1-specific protease 2-like n=1 Tax=Physella acuta TaxID=109671 RepID=UPI0027DCB388|nr:ufm1-specific protease 2-like [Physella acuta]